MHLIFPSQVVHPAVEQLMMPIEVDVQDSRYKLDFQDVAFTAWGVVWILLVTYFIDLFPFPLDIVLGFIYNKSYI